jgi:ribonuclease HII
MKSIHARFSQYAWDKNKGYPTIEHRMAIKKHGISQYHRKSFRLTDG